MPAAAAAVGAGMSFLGGKQQERQFERSQANIERQGRFEPTEFSGSFGSVSYEPIPGYSAGDAGGGSYFDKEKAKRYGMLTGFGDPLGLIAAGDPRGFADPLGLFGRGLFDNKPSNEQQIPKRLVMRLAPNLERLGIQGKTSAAQAMDMSSQAMDEYGSFNPLMAAMSRFGIMEQLLAPDRERSLGQLDTNLFRRGLLTSTTGYGAQREARQGIEQERLRSLLESFGEARAQQASILQGATGFGDLAARMTDIGLAPDKLSLDAIATSIGGGTELVKGRGSIASGLAGLGPKPSASGSLLQGLGSALSSYGGGFGK